MTDKDDLALCLRMLEHQGIIDYNGHASIRCDAGMFINIGDAQRSRMTADDICTIDFDGNLIEGKGKPPLEFHLHAGIYKARPDVKAFYTIPTFHNPMGTTTSVAHRRALLAIAARHGKPIIEDGFEMDLRPRGKAIPSLFPAAAHSCQTRLR